MWQGLGPHLENLRRDFWQAVGCPLRRQERGVCCDVQARESDYGQV